MNINNHLSTMESLPNEILIDLYGYFDGQELYNIFYNLNSRFNSLIQSLSYLSYYFQAPFDNIIDYNIIFSSQIYTLNIYSKQNIKFNQFFNIHRLIIWFPTDEQIIQINSKTFPYLEYLSVSYTIANSSICSLYQKIFSNNFPLLKSCFLSGHELSIDTIEWTQSPNLQYLYITSIDPSILNACQNLYSLNLILPTLNNISKNFNIYINLKRMKLILTSIIWFENEKKFEILFSSMPNIERLSLHKLFSVINSIDLLRNYDWLSTIIIHCLPLLKQFTYYIYIFNLFNIDQTDIDQNLLEIKKKFSKIYKNQSEYFLKIKQYNT
ncbi:unnamed protein product [Rotaria sordida]|uniref:F-box domain-containing protein n=2 Tax=Rotaria sordida TaxID=392033 RepID=A0A813SEG3_9BILA|nr:unnamed protein product [Rotaria sordida]